MLQHSPTKKRPKSNFCKFLQDETLKKQSETSKVREVLIVQDILMLLADEAVREDFLNETNGACKLEPSDLDLLDKL